jgi:hypothetical protein
MVLNMVAEGFDMNKLQYVFFEGKENSDLLPPWFTGSFFTIKDGFASDVFLSGLNILLPWNVSMKLFVVSWYICTSILCTLHWHTLPKQQRIECQRVGHLQAAYKKHMLAGSYKIGKLESRAMQGVLQAACRCAWADICLYTWSNYKQVSKLRMILLSSNLTTFNDKVSSEQPSI